MVGALRFSHLRSLPFALPHGRHPSFGSAACLVYSCAEAQSLRCPLLARERVSLLQVRGWRVPKSFQCRAFSARSGYRSPDEHTMATKTVGDGDVKLVNRLDQSRSPYVRAHASNPVAWQEWNPETLALAKTHNRLIFLSIGYAACHWCHVMERESFMSPAVAEILNTNFIPIKVDREERPDIDRVYMNYVQATTGGGGWPLNVFLTPALNPVFGGTYFPGPDTKISSHSSSFTFTDILEQLVSVWRDKRADCLDQASKITAQLEEFAQEGRVKSKNDVSEDGLELDLLSDSLETFRMRWDETNKGFGRAPKFPTTPNLAFLLRLPTYGKEVREVVGESECRESQRMAVEMLVAMAHGGIHDQIGTGFARYSVTKDWSLPHFEKMLYDNAQLLPVYLDAWLQTGCKDQVLLDSVHDIATYLTSKPLHAETGGFYSSEDADSLPTKQDEEKKEGAFYVWTLREVKQILGSDQLAEIAARYWHILPDGNVDRIHDAHDELLNQNVLQVRKTIPEVARELGMSEDEVKKMIAEARAKLLEHRDRERCRPALDDKIIVGWNGLAIGGLARAAAALQCLSPDDPTATTAATRYLTAAEKAVTFIQRELYNSTTHILRRVYREGPGTTPGFADDYAFLISGLLDLYEATFDDSYLRMATELQDTQIKLFYDTTGAGGFYSTESNAADVLMRLKDGMDNAEPATNSISARNLYRLSSALEDPRYAALAQETLEAFEAEVMQHPFLFAGMMDSVVALRCGVRSRVVTGTGKRVSEWLANETAKGTTAVQSTVRLGPEARSDAWIRQRNPLLRNLPGDKEAVLLCERGSCQIVLE